jgi:hypothetical protein
MAPWTKSRPFPDVFTWPFSPATPHNAVLVVDLGDLSHEPFRCVASEIWGVDNNLNIANMDWEEFAGMAESDGVFRRFA